MDHSSQVVLIDPDGRFAGFIRPQPGADGRPAGMPPAAVATDMIALARWQP
jgi:cytochrome oxidase Cu insertion factor (SCO1/SenC/PrrC family)